MMGRRWLYLFCLFLLPLPAMAVEAVASYAIFHKPLPNGKDSAFLELYWRITPTTLHFHKDSSGNLIARIGTMVRISQDTGVVLKDVYVLQTRPYPPGAAATQSLMEQQRYALPSGAFTIELGLTEKEFPTGNFYFKDTISTVAPQTPFYSSLQFLDTVIALSKPSPFLKNGQQQLPKCLYFMDEGERRLHYYTELYHTDSLPAASFPLKQRFFISRKQGDPTTIRLLETDSVKAGMAKINFLKTFNIDVLASGNYYLNTETIDHAGNMVCNNSVFFQCVNKHPANAPLPSKEEKIAEASNNYHVIELSNTFVSKYDAAQLRAILKMIAPTADAQETNVISGFLKKMDEMYARFFIYNYFSKQNPKDPAQAWKDFTTRIKAINKDFNAPGTPGYETHRGVIYLKYGKPDERIRVVSEQGAIPYEIWKYDAMGKTKQPGLFLFYQPGMAAQDFRLLHSTVPGEFKNPDWRSVLYISGAPDGASRAEEYFGK